MSKWPLVPLGNILTERQEVPPDYALASGEIPIIAKISFDDGRIQLRAEGQTKTGMILIRPGDFVVSGINAAKGAIAIYGEKNTRSIAATIHYGAYIPQKERVDISFLWWLLRSRTFRSLLLEYVPGGVKTELKSKRLLPIPIPLPPLPEQQRIVARIETLAVKIEEASGFRQQVAQEINSLVKSEINAHFLAEQAKGTAFRNIGSFTSYDRYGPRFYNEEYSEDGIPILRATDINEEGKINYKAMPKMSVAPQDIESFSLQRGDLAIVRSGSIGLSAVFDRPDFPCIPAAYLLQFRFNSSMNPYYVRHCLQCPLITDELKGRGTALKNINASKIKSLLIPTPELSEQRRTVTYFDGLQDKVDALKKLQSETAAELAALLPSILDKAFKGQL